MIFEWYSGSDGSGDLPREIRRFSYQANELSFEKRTAFFVAAYERERDPNWRGYLKHFLGCQYLAFEKTEEAVRLLEEALTEFDPLAANFRDVAEQYGRTLFYLIREHYIVAGDSAKLVEYAVRLLPYVHDLDADREEMFEIYALVGQALGVKASETCDKSLHRCALEFDIKAHHLQPEEPGTLEGLVGSYFGSGNLEKAKEAYELFKQLDVEYEHSARLHEFCRKAFTRIGASTRSQGPEG